MSFRLLDERDIKSFNKNYSNALIGKLKGAVVKADDVSPMEHSISVKVLGKNLWNMSVIESTNLFTVNEDGTITIHGSNYTCGTGKKLGEICPALKAGDVVKFSIQSTGSKFIYLYGVETLIHNGYVVTITDDMLTSQVAIYGVLNTEADFTETHTIQYIQIEYGEIATDYTPYVDPSEIAVTRCGKNILGYANDFSITQDGLTIEYDADEQIFTLNGTPEKASFPINFGSHLFDKFAFPLGTDVALSIEHISGSLSAEKLTNVFYVGNSDSAGGGRNNWFSVPFPTSGRRTNISTATKKYFTYTWLYIGGDYNVTFTDYKFKVQLEIGNEATNYEKFGGVKYTPTTDGTVDISGVSPTMTLITDKAGVVIECEYIKDANAVIEKLINAINSLGGTV